MIFQPQFKHIFLAQEVENSGQKVWVAKRGNRSQGEEKGGKERPWNVSMFVERQGEEKGGK